MPKEVAPDAVCPQDEREISVRDMEILMDSVVTVCRGLPSSRYRLARNFVHEARKVVMEWRRLNREGTLEISDTFAPLLGLLTEAELVMRL